MLLSTGVKAELVRKSTLYRIMADGTTAGIPSSGGEVSCEVIFSFGCLERVAPAGVRCTWCGTDGELHRVADEVAADDADDAGVDGAVRDRLGAAAEANEAAGINIVEVCAVFVRYKSMCGAAPVLQ